MSTASASEVQITSIRLEPQLKERLKKLAGGNSYQSLIRKILWNYVATNAPVCSVARDQIVFIVQAIAEQDQQCAVTGNIIRASERMYLGFHAAEGWLPLSLSW